jgi:hypothetical protein
MAGMQRSKVGNKAAEDCAHSKTLARCFTRPIRRQVLECAQSSAAFCANVGRCDCLTCHGGPCSSMRFFRCWSA